MSVMASVCCSAALLVLQGDLGFTGVWTKNVEQSDDAQAKMREAMDQIREPAGRRGGFRGRPPGGERPRGMGPRAGGGARPELGPVADELELELTESELRIDDGERLRIYYLDGEEHRREMADGARLETVAELKGRAIVIREKMERGRLDRKLELSPDGKRMVSTVSVELGRMKDPVVIRTVYEKVVESTSY